MFVLILLGAVVIASGVTLYWQHVEKVLEQDLKNHVEAAGEESADDFNRLMFADLQTLRSVGLSAEVFYPWQDSSQIEQFLKVQTQHNAFKFLGIITTDGKLFMSRQKKLTSAFTAGVLARTLERGDYLSAEPVRDPVDREKVLVESVLLHKDGVPVGALFAFLPLERFDPMLSLAALGDMGFSLIIRRDGTVVLGNSVPVGANAFDLLDRARFAKKGRSVASIRSAMTRDEHALADYRLDNARRFLHFMPLHMNDWYMFSILPTAFVEQQARRLAWTSLGLVGFIAAIFVGLICCLFRVRSASNRRLFATAYIDPLTGADNFNSMGEQFTDRLAGLNGKAALVVFDIVKFKVINDLHGYERGNKVLQRVADVLRENMRPGEFFCRSSADNFIMLLSYDDRRKFRTRLVLLATQIRRDCTVSSSCLMVDSAFGVYEITEDIPFYIMLDRTHLALENAKKISGDKIQFYDEADLRRIVAEKQIESTMEEALERGDFSVYLQPKCDFSTGRMVGAEALVRWNKGDSGLVRPDDFIPIFEKNGFILRLDMFILEQVVSLLAQWKQRGLKQVPIAVNFSRLHLNDSRYIPQMTRLVDKYGVPHNLIEVELTENVIFNNLECAQNVIRGLHRKGFSVAMDDFGSGYSSLNVLKNLQFDGIKMDKEFLDGFEKNANAKKVIEGAVDMIKSLGVKVIAEGVETQEQADFLRETGCDVAQGYLFSKPMSVEAFEEWLKEDN
uniref:Sensor domain-containing phosphodiesterase n=1 Tax=uncultured Elusimicrobia bacterium TaxID=699876 RepID=A0A650ELX0_9BACT|nr:sensor domain-containing phosphodiesterase [uncultured Elusimicrobia bacterium]